VNRQNQFRVININKYYGIIIELDYFNFKYCLYIYMLMYVNIYIWNCYNLIVIYVYYDYLNFGI
jgi:hypothetical protein